MRARAASLAASAALALALAGSAAAQDAGCLGFEAAMRSALDFDPRIEGASAQADAARANVLASQALDRPSVSLFGQYGFGDTQPIDRTRDDQVGVQATIDLYTFGQRKAAQAAAQAQLQAARLGVKAARADIAEGVAIAYLDVLQAASVLDLARGQAETYARDAELSQSRLDRAIITLTDASQIRARFAVAQSDVVNAEVAYEAALVRLSVLADLPVACVAEDSATRTLGADAQTVLALSPEAAAERAKARSYQLRQARAGRRAAEASYDEAKRANLPTLSANAFALYNYGEAAVFEDGVFAGTENVFDGQERVGLALRQDLYAGGRNAARRADARARVRQARSDVDFQALVLEDRVKRALVQARAAREAGLGLLEASREGRIQLDATTREYERGTKTLTDLVLATESYYGAARRETEARFAFYSALTRLYAALGTLTDVSG